MHRLAASLPVTRSDVWSLVTLAVFIGLVLTLAVRTPATGIQNASVITSTVPADQPNPL